MEEANQALTFSKENVLISSASFFAALKVSPEPEVVKNLLAKYTVY